MYIYKITNKANNKIYIGQTIKNIEDRFKEHVYAAEHTSLKTKLAQAIRKYGKENFSIEKIDEASSKDELNKKEIFWIKKYSSVKNGYNMTEEAIGGNTYRFLLPEEMERIKTVISASKKGGLNPNAQKIKCKNILTAEEHVFNSLEDCKNFFKETNHNFITRRINNKTKYLYKSEWLIAYFEDDYITDYTTHKNNRKSKEIIVTNISTGETKDFHSYTEAEKYFNLKPKELSSHAYRYGNEFNVKDFHIIVK